MYLYGASGHSKVIVEILESLSIPVQGLYDDNEAIRSIWEYKVMPFPGNFDKEKDKLIISIGSNTIRKQLAIKLNVGFGVAIHPGSDISTRTTIGEGTVIMAGVNVNADTKIGKHCIINTNSSVDHDCVLGDYVHISPGATLCGSVKVGEGTHIGAGAVVIPGINIGNWAVIGAGAVVIKDVPDGVIVIGNPATNKAKNS
jgi:acetyltransferase EpsM